MYEGRINVLDVADFAVHLPRGSLISEWFGGWGAITGVEEALWRVEYTLIAVNAGKKKPSPPTAPKGVRDVVLDEKKKRKAQVDRARALASMQAALSTVKGGGS